MKFAKAFPSHLASAPPGEKEYCARRWDKHCSGGTGSPDFVPCVTTIAFHAEESGNIVTGGFEWFTRVPAVSTGPGSAQFAVNAAFNEILTEGAFEVSSDQ